MECSIVSFWLLSFDDNSSSFVKDGVNFLRSLKIKAIECSQSFPYLIESEHLQRFSTFSNPLNFKPHTNFFRPSMTSPVTVKKSESLFMI